MCVVKMVDIQLLINYDDFEKYKRTKFVYEQFASFKLELDFSRINNSSRDFNFFDYWIIECR